MKDDGWIAEVEGGIVEVLIEGDVADIGGWGLGAGAGAGQEQDEEQSGHAMKIKKPPPKKTSQFVGGFLAISS